MSHHIRLSPELKAHVQRISTLLEAAGKALTVEEIVELMKPTVLSDQTLRRVLVAMRCEGLIVSTKSPDSWLNEEQSWSLASKRVQKLGLSPEGFELVLISTTSLPVVRATCPTTKKTSSTSVPKEASAEQLSRAIERVSKNLQVILGAKASSETKIVLSMDSVKKGKCA